MPIIFGGSGASNDVRLKRADSERDLFTLHLNERLWKSFRVDAGDVYSRAPQDKNERSIGHVGPFLTGEELRSAVYTLVDTYVRDLLNRAGAISIRYTDETGLKRPDLEKRAGKASNSE